MFAPIKNASGKVDGIVDLINRKAYTVEKGKPKEIEIPDSMSSELEELYTAVNESVAETSEELMEKYFSGEAFTVEEVVSGLKTGLRDLTLFPVFCGSAVTGLGTVSLLNAVVSLFPSPLKAMMKLTRTETSSKPIRTDRPALLFTRRFPINTENSASLKSSRAKLRPILC
jgi:elongation factor G